MLAFKRYNFFIWACSVYPRAWNSTSDITTMTVDLTAKSCYILWKQFFLFWFYANLVWKKNKWWNSKNECCDPQKNQFSSAHSMATDNLKKSEDFVTNTTTASKYIYLGGQKSAWIEIPPFRRFLWSKFSKLKNFKNFRIAPKNFFA